jgi:hypothetical protein
VAFTGKLEASVEALIAQVQSKASVAATLDGPRTARQATP